MAADRAWSETTKDPEKMAAYIADGGSVYAPGMPVVTGGEAIRKMFTQMIAAPGFSLSWTATKAEVGAAGDIGYTTGTYQSTMGGVSEKGKYVTAWKKQADGTWKVTEDIFNADEAPKAPAGTHAMVAANTLKWGDAPPGMPAGMRAAVVSGDPSQAQPYVLRAQLPANYRIPPHWHPTTENITVLSGYGCAGHGREVRRGGDAGCGGRRIRVGARGDAALFHVEDRRDDSGAWNRTVQHHVPVIPRTIRERRKATSWRRGRFGPLPAPGAFLSISLRTAAADRTPAGIARPSSGR